MQTIKLKTVLRERRDSMPEPHAVRLHRAISWMFSADGQADNPDMQFISLWIAFNACYGIDEQEKRPLNERTLFSEFIQKLTSCDAENQIYECLWERYSGPVRTLIDNKYVFQPFWDWKRNEQFRTDWELHFERSKHDAKHYLGSMNVPKLLGIVLDRLYVLRNQLVHGGATYQSNINRGQVQDGCRLLGFLMPVIIEIMLDSSDHDWGEIYYPVIN